MQASEVRVGPVPFVVGLSKRNLDKYAS